MTFEGQQAIRDDVQDPLVYLTDCNECGATGWIPVDGDPESANGCPACWRPGMTGGSGRRVVFAACPTCEYVPHELVSENLPEVVTTHCPDCTDGTVKDWLRKVINE
jgi:hypothetical protein